MRRLRSKIAIWIMCTAATCAALAQERPVVEVYGIALGAPLQLPQCTPNNFKTRPCVEKAKGPDRYTEVRLKLSSHTLGERHVLAIVGGRVEGVQVNTRGESTRHKDYPALVEKFGPPTSIGVKSATWMKPGLVVHYDIFSPDHGLLYIFTDAGRRFFMEKDKTTKKDPKPL